MLTKTHCPITCYKYKLVASIWRDMSVKTHYINKIKSDMANFTDKFPAGSPNTVNWLPLCLHLIGNKIRKQIKYKMGGWVSLLKIKF